MYKSAAKKSEKKRPSSRHADKKETLPRGIKPDGLRIFRFMKSNKVAGNFRDFVLFVGDQMLDNSGSYKFRREPAKDGDPPPANIALVHKEHLHYVIGEKQAERFWNKKLKRRVHVD